jgi:hypothetical protein
MRIHRRWLVLIFLLLFSISCSMVNLPRMGGEAYEELPTRMVIEQPTVCPVCPVCPKQLPPTQAAAPLPTATSTPLPTQTPLPSPTLTTTPVKMPYQVQANSPVYMPNYFHKEAGCQWTGIAGQVFDVAGMPKTNMVVVVEGRFGNNTINSITVSGRSRAYGPAGYEVQLGDEVLSSNQALKITLFDTQGKALTFPIPFSTQADCSKAVIIMNFSEKPYD